MRKGISLRREDQQDVQCSVQTVPKRTNRITNKFSAVSPYVWESKKLFYVWSRVVLPKIALVASCVKMLAIFTLHLLSRDISVPPVFLRMYECMDGAV